MPWSIKKQDDEWCVIKDSDESVEGCHETEDEAEAQLTALNIAEEERGRMSRREKFMKRIGDIVREIFPDKQEERAIAMSRLWGQVQSQLDKLAGYPWLNDIYRDDDGSLYGVVARDGMLFRVAVSVEGETVTLGEFEQVTEVHQPVGRMVIREQKDGRFRWFSISSTAILNRVGEIDSTSLYDSFIAHAEETREYPVRDFYHLGDVFRTGQFDFLAREGFAFITSGLFDDTELAKREIAARQSDPDFWGDSIKFKATEQPEMIEVGGFEIPVYRAGVLHYVSTVAEKDAAAWFTKAVVQEVNRMNKRTKEAWVKLFDGDEDAADQWLEENAEELNRSIEEGGFIKRDGETLDEETELQVDLDESLVEEIVRQMEEGENFVLLAQRNDELSGQVETLTEQFTGQIETLTEQVASLVERLAAVEVDEQEKKREFLGSLPAAPKVRAGFRPREQREEEDGRRGPDLSDIPGAY